MKKKESTAETPKDGERITLTIVKNKDIIEVLRSPALTLRFILITFCIVLFLFIGLSWVLRSIKKVFPYNTITTNPYGATLMQDEDKTVAYWLFNTATFWADSGIEVEQGDVLTIRASGSMNTAVHHLVEDADKNRIATDPWMDTDGGRDTEERNPDRSRHRIAPGERENVLLMRVYPPTEQDDRQETFSRINSYYVIGKEKSNVYIRENGRLQFTVNDIDMTPAKLREMYREERDAFIDIIKKEYPKGITIKNSTIKISNLEKEWKSFSNDFFSENEYANITNSKLTKDIVENKLDSYKTLSEFIKIYKIEKESSLKNLDSLIRNHGLKVREVDANGWEDYYPVINEYKYYYSTKFRDAWYLDNIGSFLIVIEKRNPK